MTLSLLPIRRLVDGWHAGFDQEIESLAKGSPSLLRQLVVADFQCRWIRHDPRPVEMQLARFPHFRDSDSLIIELVAVELRHMVAEPDAERYRERFPKQWDRLRPLLEVRQILGQFTLTETYAKLGTPPATPSASIPAPLIPGYEFEEWLGSGSAGAVFRARHLKLNRTVAVKVMRSMAQDDAQRIRFEIEAQLVASLQHPAIVQVYEIGEAEGLPFIAFEYCARGNLAARIVEPWEPRTAAGLMLQLARAVAAAHRGGVVHRDLKPANILFASDGTPRIADFGLAKQVHAASTPPSSEAILGTPSYMSPEQAAGGSAQAGPVADVYSLGAMLYELLSGKPPFHGSSLLDTLMAVRFQDPVPLKQLRPQLSADLVAIVEKCLSKKPEARYATADVLADDLQKFLNHEPIGPAGVVTRIRKWCRRKPGMAILAVALVLTMLGGLAAVLSAWGRAVTDRERALASRRIALQIADQAFHRLLNDDRLDYPHLHGVRKELAEAAIAHLENFLNHWREDHGVMFEAATAYWQSAKLKMELQRPAYAKSDLNQALELYQRLHADSRSEELPRIGLGKTLLLTGVYHRRVGDLRQAEETFMSAEATLEEAAGSPQLESERIRYLAEVKRVLGQIRELQGRNEEMVRLHREATRSCEGLVTSHPDRNDYFRDAMRANLELGIALHVVKQPTEALEVLSSIVERIEARPTLRDQTLMRRTVAACCNAQGLILSKTDPEKAKAFLEKALALREELANALADNLGAQGELATTCHNLAAIHRARNDCRASLPLQRRACEALARSIENDWPEEKHSHFFDFHFRLWDDANRCNIREGSLELFAKIARFPTGPARSWAVARQLASRLDAFEDNADRERPRAAAELNFPLQRAVEHSHNLLVDIEKDEVFSVFRTTTAWEAFRGHDRWRAARTP
jgi:tetratricopeptide (TPR) repeat protein